MSRRLIARFLSQAGIAALGGTAVLAQPAHPAHTAGPSDRLGRISFPTSAVPAAQAEFVRGVLYLHSFEYESAARAFQRAEALQPDFALAYWGEAMTHTHPVWNEQDVNAARAALGRLAATAEARRAKAPTPREQAWLGAVEVLYGSGAKAARDTLYAAAMEQLVRDYPAELEPKAFYALALLGLNQGIRDTTTYLRAAAYADTVFRANPEHPGAAHYLIHSYDDPLHAARGLEAARAYEHIAPDAPHAQHMTTHIFLALGMWDDVVSQNQLAVGLTAKVPGHYTSWLAYGLLQQGRYEDAARLLEELRANLGSTNAGGRLAVLAQLRAHFLLLTGAWDGAIAGWRLDRAAMLPLGRLTELFTDGMRAYRRRDSSALADAARQAQPVAFAIAREAGEGTPGGLAARVISGELEAMRLVLAGARDSSLRVLRAAAATEDAMPMEFGPPAIVLPSHELLGSFLLKEAPAEAAREFARALVLAPGRSPALAGAVRAAVAVGDGEAARRALARLASNWRSADPGVRDTLNVLSPQVSRLP